MPKGGFLMNRYLVASVIIAWMVFSLASCAAPPPAPDPAAVRSAIEEANSRFSQAYNQGDTSTLASLYDADAVILPPNAPESRGNEQIAGSFAQEIEQMQPSELRLNTQEVEVAGDFAFEMGAYTARIGALNTVDEGKYLVVWKKQADGSWKLYRDIWNSNLPLPSPTPAADPQP